MNCIECQSKIKETVSKKIENSISVKKAIEIKG